MNKNSQSRYLNLIVFIGFAFVLFSSCTDDSLEGNIIITRTEQKVLKADFVTGNQWQYISKAQIILLNPHKGEGSLKELTTDFYSAMSPSVSYDAEHMLFAGQKTEEDIWQIWEMKLNDQKARQLTFSDQNCTNPAYLPNGRFVYSCSNKNDSLKAGHSLYTANLDGSDNKRITFNPGTYFASNVLKDGRILTIGQQLVPLKEEQRFVIMLPDGTKADLFFKGVSGSTLISKGGEYSEDRILFIESVKGNVSGGKLASINYNRPLHSSTDLAPNANGSFLSVSCGIDDGILVSYRNSDTELYSIYEFDYQNKVLGRKIYSDVNFNMLDAFIVEKRPRPKKLPSEVNADIKTGLLMCQDINVFDINDSAKNDDLVKSVKIELLGLYSSLGTVDVEADGSFYLKVEADKPFRIQTLDKDGKVLRGPSAWMWLRPNERRGCVGCHQDPELAPQNKIPMAVKKDPVEIPNLINM